MFLEILIFILILGILVLSHELGHLIVAKRAGVRVDEFAFGFPPRLFQKKIGETLYSFNLIPIGGYVKIHGESGENRDDPKSFSNQRILTRIKIISAGVGMNLLTACFLMIILSFFSLYQTNVWYQAVFIGIADTFRLLGFIFDALFQIISSLIITGRFIGDILGPIGIAYLTSDIVGQGFLHTLHFIALLSLNLAVINILPFPALDGGRLLFLFLEKIKGSPVKQKTEQAVHAAGMALLIFLMVLVTWRDILRII